MSRYLSDLILYRRSMLYIFLTLITPTNFIHKLSNYIFFVHLIFIKNVYYVVIKNKKNKLLK